MSDAYRSEIGDRKRANSLSAIVSRFTSAQRSAFDQLRKLEEEYAVAYARGEIDLSGTARAMFQIDGEQTLQEGFLVAFEVFRRADTLRLRQPVI